MRPTERLKGRLRVFFLERQLAEKFGEFHQRCIGMGQLFFTRVSIEIRMNRLTKYSECVFDPRMFIVLKRTGHPLVPENARRQTLVVGLIGLCLGALSLSEFFPTVFVKSKGIHPRVLGQQLCPYPCRFGFIQLNEGGWGIDLTEDGSR